MIGGEDAQPGDMPGMLGLTAEGKDNYGGAALIEVLPNGRGKAITAAHCLKYDLNTVRVRGGSLEWNDGGYQATVKEYFINPHYSLPAGIDMAVLILDGVPADAQTAPALAGQADQALYQPGSNVTTFGWGPTKLNGKNPDHLQKGTLPLVDPTTCDREDRLSNAAFTCCKPVDGRQSSPGDSGGPVISGADGHRRLVAVVEGGRNSESIGTRVDMQLPWIQNPTGVRSIVVGSRPMAVAVGADGRKYVAHASETYLSDKQAGAPGSVSVFNNDWTPGGTIAAGNPSAIAVSTATGMVYVADRANNTVSMIDPATSQVVGAPVVLKNSPSCLVLTANNSRLYVLNGDAVTILDAADLRTVQNIKLNTDPKAIAAAPDGARVYISNGENSDITVVDTAANSVAATWDIGDYGNPSIAAAAGHVYVGSTGQEVYVVDLAGQKTAEIQVSAFRGVKALAVAGTDLFVGYESTNSSNLPQIGVQIFDIQQVGVAPRTLELGGAPLAALASTPAGEVLAVNRDVSSISIVHP